MTVDAGAMARSPLFAGLGLAQLEQLARRGTHRQFGAGEALCRAGEPSEACWLITAGLVHVSTGAEPTVMTRRRKGDTVGEIEAILDEPRRETVIASIPTTTIELAAADLRALVEDAPAILLGALRTVHTRLTHAHERTAAARELGETVALAAGASLQGILGPLLAAARRATPRSVTALDRRFSFAGAVTAAEQLVSGHSTVLMFSELDAETLTPLLRETDRVVALAGTAAEARALGTVTPSPELDRSIEVVTVGEDALRASREWPAGAPVRLTRSCPRAEHFPLGGADLGWLARHLTRTKLGLALGAGGAKGYAHVGVLQVLEEAGYVVDCVAGSSIGAIVGAYLALGMDAAAIEATLRGAFDQAAVAEIFKTSLAGRATGLELMSKLMRETTGERTFAETRIPLTVMAVDLSERAPAPQREGPIWEALLAATALAGVFAPYVRDGHRLVDGLALVPVPTGALEQDGADVTVSVNLIARETLRSWPDGPPPEPPPERRRRGVLDDLLEVMDLSQLAESTRHAEMADVPICPRFGPGEWRDFHLADQFLAAGRAAAAGQLPRLRSLALPALPDDQPNEQGGGIDRADAVRV
jgi:NTE family protein